MAMFFHQPPGRRTLTKTRLVMRLIALLPTIVFLNVHASGKAQSVSFSGRHVPLKKVFSVIEKQTGYFVFYDAGLLNSTRPVTLTVSDMPLRSFLDFIKKDQAFSYRIVNKTISIIWNEPEASDPPEAAALPAPAAPTAFIPITGIIRGPDGKPLAGVSIMVKKTKKGTSSAKDGSFSIDAGTGDILVISSIGFANREILIDKQTSLGDIRMKTYVGELDQSVVIGYGTTSRRLNTGSVSTVKAEDLEKQPVLNPLLALRGLVPGLVITPTGGYASSPVKIEIRGRNNINPNVSSEPLIMIDGMPLITMNLDGGDQTNGANILPDLRRYQLGALGQTPAGGESPLFGLNPKDIESITVLKDADATSIYGSRGANGVILITTKKSKAHATEFNINASEGISKVTRHYNMMNTSQYVAMRKEALKNDGLPLTTEFAPDLLIWDTTRNVDWQKELWGGIGKVTNVTAGLSGGSNNTSFRLSGNFGRQTDILTVAGGSEAGNLSFNLNHHTTDQKLSTSFSSVYTHGATNQVNQGALASTLPPNAPPMYDSKGALNYAEWNATGFQLEGQFPFGSLLQRSKSATNTFNSNLTLGYRPIKGLELRTSIGYRTTQSNVQGANPIIAQNPLLHPTASALFTAVVSSGWSIEPQLDYSRQIGPGKLSVLLGGTIQSGDSRYNVENGTGFTNDALLKSINNAPVQAAYDAYGQYKYAGVFSRINYDFRNKYVLSLGGRRDGSSRFGPGNQFGNFASVGAAWIASEEKWIRRALPSFISFFKFRASYGTTGSDGVADYQYLSQWASGTLGTQIPGYNGITRPLVSQHAVNQNFHWQSNKQMDQAVEMDFLPDSRMTLQVDHYTNRCSNQLVSYPTPIFTGFGSVTANWQATVQNSGWEISLSAKVIDNKDVKWLVSGNISFNNNKLAAYPNIEYSPYYTTLLVGQSLNASYLYHYIGVDPLNGAYSVADYSHDGTISSGNNYAPLSESKDNKVVINLNPKYTGGLSTQFSYKSFGVSMLFDFKKQYGKNAYFISAMPGTILFNQPVEIIGQQWQKPGDQKKFAAFSTGAAYGVLQSSQLFNGSDGVFTDASYIRLSNLSLSYNLPDKMAKKMGMRGCNMYVNAQNVFTFTKYKGTDPELQSFSAMPQAKVFVGGISFNF